MASLFSKHLFGVVGLIPFLSAGLATAFPIAQNSVIEQELHQINDLCSLDTFESVLAQGSWNHVVEILADCESDQLADTDTLVTTLNSYIRSDNEAQQIVALYALRQLEESVENPGLFAELDSAGLVTQLTDLLGTQIVGSTSKGIAAEVVGAFAVRVINEGGAADLDLTVLVNTLLTLSAMDSDRPQVKISAVQALRNIGRALQTNSDLALSESDHLLAEQVVAEMEGYLSDRSFEQNSSSATQQRLLTEIQVARVEALSAFLFINNPGAEVAFPSVSEDFEASSSSSFVGEQTEPLCLSDPVNTPLSITSYGIQFLNCLSAKAEVETLVRAAAITELERLGTIAPYRHQVAEELRHIALTNADTDIRISAVEAMSRVEALPAPSSWPAWEDELHRLRRLASTNRDEENSQSFGEGFDLLQLLAIGLESSSKDGSASALRQRAEIAFDQIYDQNLDQLVHAIWYSGGSGNKAIQRNAVQALGAVNYRRLSASANSNESLKTLTRFLGQSLLCASDAEVRRDAAFALGQLAPYHTDLFDEPLELYDWHRLLPDRPPSSFSEPLIEVCRATAYQDGEEMGKQLHAQATSQDGEDINGQMQQAPKVIDALILRLDDREENIVVAASYALSRYGIALDSTLKEAAFLNLPKDETIEATLDELKTCMKALISPTRFGKWPDDASTDPMYQPLAALTEEYSEICQDHYLLPEQGRNESAIAAAYILGQVGFSDGSSEATDDEQETVDFLLRALRGRDMLAQQEFNRLESTRLPLNENSPSTDYSYRVDSVRDSIVSYVFSQIHPREHDLIQKLGEAVTFPDKQQQRYDPSRIYVERALSCEDPTRPADDLETIPVCIDDPITRAAVIGAIEYIGIEEIDDADPQQVAQRRRVQNYQQSLRRLLTQDVDPVLTQAVVTTVVERVMSLAALANGTASDSALATESSDSLSSFDISASPTQENSNFLFKAEAEAASSTTNSQFSSLLDDSEQLFLTQENLAEARYTLALPFTSLYSCASAAYGLARLGVYDNATVDQLVNYLYAYPEPLSRPDAESADFHGNLCMPSAVQVEGEEDSDGLPSRLEQLVIFKTGAIAALGSIGLHDPQTVKIYSRDAVTTAALPGRDGLQLEFEDLDTVSERISGVVACLVNIANLEPLVFDSESSSPCQPATGADVLNDDSVSSADISTSSMMPDERERARLLGFSPRQIEQAEKWGLTLREMEEAEKWGLTPAQRALAKQYDITRKEIDAGRELGLSVAQIVQAKKFDLTTEDISEGFSRGILLSEIIQAAKWGLTPQEFFALKLSLQEPAIATLGQLAQTEEGKDALEALAFVSPTCSIPAKELDDECQDRITSLSSVYVQGLSFERIQALKLENIKAVLLHFQDSEDADDRQKIDFIISQYLLPKLVIDETDYRVTDSIENIRNNVENTEEARANFETARARTERLRNHAEEFRNEVLKTLVSLDTETIQRLKPDTLESLINALGVGRRPEALAQKCLSAEEDLFTQERLCHGVAKLLSAALSSSTASITPVDVATGTQYLRTLATDPANEDNTNNLTTVRPGINSSFKIERSSPIIRSSAIEYLGEVGANDLNSQLILVRRLVDEDEPGVVENVVRTFSYSDPHVVVSRLQEWLASPFEAEQRQAAMLISRLGQLAYVENSDLADPEAWKIALNQPVLVNVLVEILEDPQTSEDLQVNTVNALGEVRSNNDDVVKQLYRILNDSTENVTSSNQVAAAYALGKVGHEHPAIGEGVLPDLFGIVIDETQRSEIRVVAAYALSEIGIHNYDAPIGINRHRIAYNLINLFREPIISENSESISPEAQKAIVLYTLGQLNVNDDRIAQAYADGLHPDNPFAVRAVAAAYAKNLPLWNESLADSLLDSLKDPNIAVRYGAIESIRQRQNGALRGLNVIKGILQEQEYASGEADSTYEKLFVEALVNIFWDENEYGFIRLTAGLALDDELDNPQEQETFETTLQELGIGSSSQSFIDILTSLVNAKEISVNFRTRDSITSGSEVFLQALRSSDLIDELDSISISSQILFEILESIRAKIQPSTNQATNIQAQKPENLFQTMIREGREVITRITNRVQGNQVQGRRSN